MLLNIFAKFNYYTVSCFFYRSHHSYIPDCVYIRWRLNMTVTKRLFYNIRSVSSYLHAIG